MSIKRRVQKLESRFKVQRGKELVWVVTVPSKYIHERLDEYLSDLSKTKHLAPKLLVVPEIQDPDAWSTSIIVE